MRRVFKKSFFTVSLAIILALTLMFSAFGANFEHIAEDLHDLGLFRGTAEGFELEREPTRAEAVIMMLRFFGLEEAAQASDAEHPFTDVPTWAESYIAYAYSRGLTTGATATEFRPNETCSAQMFVTFMLRALGYDDSAGDFSFANAVAFATEVGIIDSFLAQGTFLRDDMVAVSFLALNATPQGVTYDSLLEKLVSDGAVTAAAAAPVLEMFAIFEELVDIEDRLADETNISMSMTMDMNMGLLGTASAVMKISMVVEDDDILLAMDMSMEMLGEEIAMHMFMAGGYVYMEIEGEKIKMDAGLADIDFEDFLGMAEVGEFALNASYFITSITRTTQGEFTVFTMEFADSFMEASMDMAMAMLGGTGMDDMLDMGGMDVSIPGMRYYVDAAGNLAKIAMTMTMAIRELGFTIPVEVDIEIEFLAFGDDVVVTLPDNLDEFVLIEAE